MSTRLVGLVVLALLAASPAAASAESTTTAAPTTSTPSTTTTPTSTTPTSTTPTTTTPQNDPSAYAYVEDVPTASGPAAAAKPKQQSAPVTTRSAPSSDPSTSELQSSTGQVSSGAPQPARKHRRRAHKRYYRRPEPVFSAGSTTGRPVAAAASGGLDDTSLIWMFVALAAVTALTLGSAVHGRRRASA